MTDLSGANGSKAQQEDPSSLIARLTLQDDEIDDLVWEDEFNCLADWNKAMHQGPWDFNGYALILAEYDGFSNPEKVKLERLETWCQIHKLPDGVLKNKKFLENRVDQNNANMDSTSTLLGKRNATYLV
ncbi:retrotransposon unclassified [Hordeum vulgare]|nr:retrotransposon unclassified [Hordeum vulgare]